MLRKKNKGVLRSIEVSFNIFDSGWNKFGNHRKYISGNIERIMNGDIVQERIERRVMVGFFGHSSNQQLEPVENPDNLPSHLTTRLQFHPASGDVDHKQEILDTNPGRAVLSLHDSGIGNFSWRGKAQGVTAPDQFSADASRHLRFDYVYVPGMVKQSKRDIYVTESADDRNQLCQRFQENGLLLEEALQMTTDWQRQGMLLSELEKQYQYLSMENHLLNRQLQDSSREKEKRERLIQEAVQQSPYVFSKGLVGFLSGDTAGCPDEIMNYIEEIRAYNNLDTKQFPDTGSSAETRFLPEEQLLSSTRKSDFSLENSALGIYTGKF